MAAPPAITPLIWTLSVERIDDVHCECTNSVDSSAWALRPRCNLPFVALYFAPSQVLVLPTQCGLKPDNSCRRLSCDSSEGTTSTVTACVSSSNGISFSSIRCLLIQCKQCYGQWSAAKPVGCLLGIQKTLSTREHRLPGQCPVRPDLVRRSNERGYRQHLGEAEKALRNAASFAFKRSSAADILPILMASVSL